jgi:hypothetical protein
MANQRTLTGLAIVVLAGLTLIAAGCGSDDGLGPNEGRVRFVLSSDAAGAMGAGDATVSTLPELQSGVEGTTVEPTLHGDDDDGDRTGWFQSANVTFSSILARNVEGVLVDVDMELPVTVDVLKMERGKEIQLPPGDLPTGTYDQLVVVMTEVEGTGLDGTVIAITPPGGGWTSIVPICPFVVDEGSTTVVGLSFKLRNAFSWRDKKYHFQPGFSCEGDDSGTSG